MKFVSLANKFYSKLSLSLSRSLSLNQNRNLAAIFLCELNLKFMSLTLATNSNIDMKIPLLFTVLMAFCCASVFAQINFLDGYIISNKGDTIYGKIKYMTPALRSSKVIFMKSGDSEKLTYKPFQIKGYYVAETIYDSKIYDIDLSLPYGYGAFMERRNNGIVKLYYYWNTDKERGFTQTFIENDGDYLLEVDYVGFKQQMTRYFEDFPKLQSKIKQGTYKKKDLEQIVMEYNEWKESEW